MAQKRNKLPRTALAFDTFLVRATPRLWELHVRHLEPGGVATTIQLPEDRDVPNAIARAGHPSGRYSVYPKWKGRTKGESFDRERKGIFLNSDPTYGKIASAVVDVTPETAAAPREVRQTINGPQAAINDALRAEHEARAADAQARKAEADARRLRAEKRAQGDDERATAQLIRDLVQQKPDNSMGVVLQVMQQQAQSQQQFFQLLLEQQRQDKLELQKALQQAQRPSAPSDPLVAIAGQVGTMNTLFDLLERLRGPAGGGASDGAPAIPGAGEGGPWWLPLAMEFLRTKMGVQQPTTPESLPPAGAGAPALAPAGAAGTVSTNGHGGRIDVAQQAKALAAERVRAFVSVIVREVLAGTTPEGVVDALDQASVLDQLPQSVREALDRGSWSSAWTECRRYCPELEGELGQHMESKDARAWLDAFAQACVPVPESEE